MSTTKQAPPAEQPKPRVPLGTGLTIEQKRALLKQAAFTSVERGRQLLQAPKNTDDNYVYLWAYNHRDRINALQAMSYEIVRQGNDPCKTGNEMEDGTHRIGDTILMRCPRDIAELRQISDEVAGFDAINSSVQQFRDFAERSSVATYKTN